MMVAWIPMLEGDDRVQALAAADSFRGTRARQFWDGARELGREVSGGLGQPDRTAWDIYLFYPPEAEWTERGIPRPEAGLAQVAGVVVGLPGTLPARGDASTLPEWLRGRAVFVGEQDDLERLLARVAERYRR